MFGQMKPPFILYVASFLMARRIFLSQVLTLLTLLKEYAWLIKEIRQHIKAYGIIEAVDKAIGDMPGDFLIKSFLAKHKAEVEGMLDTEYNEAEIRELFMEDGRAEERINTERESRRADQESKRADEESKRADQESRRADQESERADQECKRAE